MDPVKLRGRLRGILLAGSRRKYGKLPADVLESAASELVLAIELEEEQQSGRDSQVDLLLARKTLGSLIGSESQDPMLAALSGSRQVAIALAALAAVLTLRTLYECAVASAAIGRALARTFAPLADTDDAPLSIPAGVARRRPASRPRRPDVRDAA